MKARHTYPSGQTSASRLKALLACLEAERGSGAGDAFLAKVRLARTDLEDETRLLPLAALHGAVEAFLEVLPNGLERLPSHLASRDNLGVWARVLRGTRAPEEAFARIESTDSEHGRTVRWERIEAGPGRWRGKVRLGHDPRLEKDGLLARLRQVELSIVPTLFGHGPGRVELVEVAEDSQTYEVRWTVPTAGRGIAAGIAAGIITGGAVLAVHPSLTSAFAASALAAGGALGGVFWARDRSRRIEAAAQSMRVSALERSLALRESENRLAAGELEGAVVAGQYRINERMGSGASGVIYQATRITDGLPVAIKLLRAATAHDVTASDRLRRESEALGLSWHPNVVEVIDHGHLPDGTSYLVMELLEGETLGTRLRSRVRLSPPEILPVAKQIAEAVVAIHAAGVVHRDLKPSNIYLVQGELETGEPTEIVKVFDFGIARVEWEEMRITNMGAPLGTPGYMSPEQESGGEIDGRSDVYAVGAILYECFVGEPPPAAADDMWRFATRTPSSFGMRLGVSADSGVQPASRRMPSAAPAPVSEVESTAAAASAPPPSSAAHLAPGSRVDVPSEWRAVIERALAKRPDERFQDARSLLRALRALDPNEANRASLTGEPSSGGATGGASTTGA